MTEADLDAVLAIQADAYEDPFFHETRKVLLDKLAQFPEGCQIWMGEQGPAAYLFSHPWYVEAPPALDAVLDAPDMPLDCYYIHDVAVHPSARKQGIARRFTERAIAMATEKGFSKMALIAVQDSTGYWQRHGFVEVREMSQEMAEKVRSYGDDARLMVRGG